jgi:hypothetical protein
MATPKPLYFLTHYTATKNPFTLLEITIGQEKIHGSPHTCFSYFCEDCASAGASGSQIFLVLASQGKEYFFDNILPYSNNTYCKGGLHNQVVFLTLNLFKIVKNLSINRFQEKLFLLSF